MICQAPRRCRGDLLERQLPRRHRLATGDPATVQWAGWRHTYFGIAVFCLVGLYILLWMAVSSAMHGIYVCALYQYAAHARVPEGFELRQPLLALLWCLEYASPTAAHHADTSRVCAALGIPPIPFT